MPFPNFIGSHKRYWTRERVIFALGQAAAEIKGPLPCCDATYNKIKKGRLDWPTSTRVLEYFGSMARGWLAAGAGMKRISLHNVKWSKEEDRYLLDKAGKKTLAQIGKDLGRSPDSVKTRLNKHFRIKARGNNGYFSAAEISQLYNCPYHRVRDGLAQGIIKGKFDCQRNRWLVDPVQLTPAAKGFLQAPRATWKTGAPDLGDYERRYGLRRTRVNGRVVRCEG